MRKSTQTMSRQKLSVRRKNASMVLAAKAVKEGEADAVLSAGNTGALLAAGFFIVGRIKNIDRPGLMSTLPTSMEKALIC